MWQTANAGTPRGVPGGSDARGFTLVEIVVSLALLGFGLMAALGSLRSCAGAAQHARMLTQSVLLAERLLVETRLSRQPAFEARKGQEGPYVWQVRLVPTTVESLGAVHVQVTWPEQQRPQRYDLYSLIAMPSWAQWRS